MYTLEAIHCRVKRQWLLLEDDSLATITLKQLLKDYDDVWIVLSNPHLIEDEVFDLSSRRPEFDSSEQTVNQWLEDNGELTIETMGSVREVFNRKELQSIDAWMTGFNIEYSTAAMHPQSNFHENTAKDLRVWKEGVDPIMMYHNFLPTVNGFVHPTDASEHGLYILDGNVNGRITGDNQVGLLDFRGLGGFSYHPIDDSTIKSDPMVPSNKRVVVNVDVDLTDKTVMLVLGGFLMPLDSVVKAAGEKRVALDFRNMDMDERFIDMRKSLDVSDLAPPAYFEDGFNPAYLNSPEFYDKLLRNKHSFLIAINCPKVYLEERPLAYSGFYGRYLTHRPAIGYVQFANHKLAEYINFGTPDDIVIVTGDNTKKLLDKNTVVDNDSMEVSNDSYDRDHRKLIRDCKEVQLYTYVTA